MAIATTSATFPTTPVLDTFNRANGGPGANWVDMTSTFAIATNALTQVGGGDTYVEWNSGFGASQEVYVTLAAITANSIVGGGSLLMYPAVLAISCCPEGPKTPRYSQFR